MAVKSLRSKFNVLLNLIRHCLLSLAAALFAEGLIHEDVYEKACNETIDPDSRSVAVLNCIEDRIKAVPSDFTKIVSILESEPFLRDIADELVQSYRKYRQKGCGLIDGDKCCFGYSDAQWRRVWLELPTISVLFCNLDRHDILRFKHHTVSGE